jgi:hypothetical protein
MHLYKWFNIKICKTTAVYNEDRFLNEDTSILDLMHKSEARKKT